MRRLAAAALGTLVVAASASAAVPARAHGELVVALSMPVTGFQAGSVRGSRVVYARGLEVELARALGRRLGSTRVRFVQVADARRLVAPGPKRWDIALARIVPTRARSRAVKLVPYLLADQGVLLRRGLERPRSLAALRRLQLCALRGSRGADVASARVRPAARTLLAADIAVVLRWVQTGRCDVAIHEAPLLGALVAVTPRRFGAVAARIETGATYAVVLPKRSTLEPDVRRALVTLRRAGVTGRLARAWLGFDPARLPALR